MGDYAHQLDPRLTLTLERDVNRTRFMGTSYKRKMEEDLARRTQDRIAYSIQRYVRSNPNARAALTKPYVERYAVHRILNNGMVSMLVGEFHFLEEAQEYVKNAMLGRMVFGGRVFDVSKGGIVGAGGLPLAGSAESAKSEAVLGTKTMADGAQLLVRLK